MPPYFGRQQGCSKEAVKIRTCGWFPGGGRNRVRGTSGAIHGSPAGEQLCLPVPGSAHWSKPTVPVLTSDLHIPVIKPRSSAKKQQGISGNVRFGLQLDGRHSSRARKITGDNRAAAGDRQTVGLLVRDWTAKRTVPVTPRPSPRSGRIKIDRAL